MIVLKTPPARGTPRSAPAQSSHKCAAIVVAALSLVAAFVLAGAPTATAALAAPAFTNNHAASMPGLHHAPCRGKKPGVCPNSPDMQSDGSGQVPEPYGGSEGANTTDGSTSIS